MSQLSRTRSAVLIASLVLIWGLSWPIYKVALHYTPPILFSGMRCLIGGLLLALFSLRNYKRLRFRQTWHIYLISAVFNSILYYIFQTVGLNYMPEGLLSVIVFLQPVLVGLFAWLWLHEHMSWLKIIGLFLGFMGVAAVSMESLSGAVSALGIVLGIASAATWALGTVYTKKVLSTVDPIWLVAIQFLVGGIVMTGIGSGFEQWSAITWNGIYLTGLVYGAVLGIAISWVIYFVLVRSGDASKVASYTFLTPLIAVLSGTVFLHEPFTKYLVVGIILIVASIYLVNRPKKKRTQVETTSQTAAV